MSSLENSKGLLLQKSALHLDKKQNFHKKLQGRLDTLIKEKDFKLLMDLTKAKVAHQMSSNLPKLLLKGGPSSGFKKKTTEDLNASPTSEMKKGLGLVGKLPMKSMKLLPPQQIDTPLSSGQLSPIPTYQQPAPLGLSPTLSPTPSHHSDDDTTTKNIPLTINNGGPTKSIMCKRFIKLGQCQSGDKCEFAHSQGELQFNSPQEWV